MAPPEWRIKLRAAIQQVSRAAARHVEAPRRLEADGPHAPSKSTRSTTRERTCCSSAFGGQERTAAATRLRRHRCEARRCPGARERGARGGARAGTRGNKDRALRGHPQSGTLERGAEGGQRERHLSSMRNSSPPTRSFDLEGGTPVPQRGAHALSMASCRRRWPAADNLQRSADVLFSTDVATLFLDFELNIRFFTPPPRLCST